MNVCVQCRHHTHYKMVISSLSEACAVYCRTELVPYNSTLIVSGSMQILMAADLRSPIISRIRAGTPQGTAYCSVAHLWLFVCPPIRFRIDGRTCRHRQRSGASRTRGPQAERDSGRGPHGRSSARERLSPLLKWQEEQLSLSARALRPLLAHIHSESVSCVCPL